MKTDNKLKLYMIQKLEWDPAVHASQVGVSVKGGMVTLTGHMGSYAEKYAIEQAAVRVQGVNVKETYLWTS